MSIILIALTRKGFTRDRPSSCSAKVFIEFSELK